MSCPLQPLGDKIIATTEEAKSKTASGIYLPDSAKEKSKIATVQAIGPLVKQLKVGDRIIYREYSVTEAKVDGTEYLIIKEEDILATTGGK